MASPVAAAGRAPHEAAKRPNPRGRDSHERSDSWKCDNTPMGRIVIACYRPKPGQQDALRELLRGHVPRLHALGLVTERLPIAMEARDGTCLEVFEWVSEEAIQSAHTNPGVLAMWDEFGKVCDYVPVARVPETADLFSNFTPLS